VLFIKLNIRGWGVGHGGIIIIFITSIGNDGVSIIVISEIDVIGINKRRGGAFQRLGVVVVVKGG
jgi:hypothetical protein